MSGAIDWNEYGLDFEKLKEQVEALWKPQSGAGQQ